MRKLFLFIITLLIIYQAFTGCTKSQDGYTYFIEHYEKNEVKITMRDGIKLFTSIYKPKDSTEKLPIILWRTPYSCSPYGEDNYPKRRLSSILHFIKGNYIIVFQDVRGKFMSEGEYVNMRPYIPNKIDNNTIDESTDAYDTVEWLVNNVDNNNGKVGIWGISYPGFYAAMSTIDAHPALKAVSPQAPIADWFIGDDMHHNGAFTLLLNFNFFDVFGLPRNELTTTWPEGIEYPSPDAYNFFLDLGPLKNINERYFKNDIPFFDSTSAHPDYDYFWQKRNTLPHFNNIKPAVMTVGGWYDGEDLYGALQTYKSIEKKNNVNNNFLVMGPWPHGGWSRGLGEKFGDMNFGFETGSYYIQNIELPFFNYYLKEKDDHNLPEAFIFNTGKNEWLKFDTYPPKNLVKRQLYFYPDQLLKFEKQKFTATIFEAYISDPQKPVPYTAKFLDSKSFYNREYMVEDQRFAASRPDVLVYETEKLTEDLTIAGPLNAELFVSTSGTDADWVIKIIDVFPDEAPNPKPNLNEIEMGGFQMLVRGEIMRGKYRNSYENPQPFTSNEITNVNIALNDVCHTFKKGHKIMVQIQSSWFPLFDINPQTFVDIYKAEEKDFIKTTNKLYFGKKYPSNISFGILE